MTGKNILKNGSSFFYKYKTRSNIRPMKKFLSIVLLVASAVVAQAQSISPTSATVFFDKSSPSTFTIPDVTLTNLTNVPYFFTVTVGNGFDRVIIPNPTVQWNTTVAYVPAGSTAAVHLVVNTTTLQNFAVGTYNVPITFNPVYTNGSTNAQSGLTFMLVVNIVANRNVILPTTNQITIPHLAAGGVWKTHIQLTNPSSTPSVNELKFYDDNGYPLNFSVNGFPTSYIPAITVPAKGFIELIVDNPSSVVLTGVATLQTDSGSVPGINTVYENISPRFETSVEIKPSVLQNFSLSFDNTPGGRHSTGVAISNALNYPQSVTLEFDDINGNNLLGPNASPLSVIIQGNGHTIFTIDQAYPFTAGKAGTLRVTGTQPSLFGFGLVFSLDTGWFYTEPAFAN